MQNFKIDVDADGIALVTFDMKDRSQNVFNESSVTELAEIVERFQSDDAIKGVVITSGKKGFSAGGDLEMLGKMAAAAASPMDEAARKDLFEKAVGLNRVFRALETCGKPVAAAINGSALGGGLEICLACHHRIVADDDSIRLGLPEPKVGVLQGAGGTQRLPRLIGVQAAAPFLLQGKTVPPQRALKEGIVHAVVPAKDLIAECKKRVQADETAKQPWDQDKYKVPGGGPFHPVGMQNFLVGNAMLRKETYGNYPAQKFIMQSVFEGLQLPMDAAIRVESRYFLRTLETPESQAMIRTLFFSLQELNKGARRPADVAETKVKKLGVLGAGLMGAGVAYVSAQAGMDVVLLDVNKDNAEKGKGYSTRLLDKDLGKGRITEADKQAFLDRITPTDSYDDLADCDFIVEAVFENPKIKDEVIRAAEAKLGSNSIFGTNTSTLPISQLAESSVRPDRFIGVHFFSPVERMPLVELIKGEKTGDEAVARALDYVKQIKKTPIVVNDSRGFYTSRCFGTYMNEGLLMLAEGVNPALIENAGRMAGMPMGPMEVGDSVGMDTALKIARESLEAIGSQSGKEQEAIGVMAKLVETHGRVGRKAEQGFYEYENGKPSRIWPEVYDFFPRAEKQPSGDEVKVRLMTIQALEAARCVEEGVVTDMREADIGAIFGWGFAPFTGGPITMIDQIGLEAFVQRCEALAAKHGDRFKPNALLKDLAAKGATFYATYNPDADLAKAA